MPGCVGANLSVHFLRRVDLSRWGHQQEEGLHLFLCVFDFSAPPLGGGEGRTSGVNRGTVKFTTPTPPSLISPRSPFWPCQTTVSKTVCLLSGKNHLVGNFGRTHSHTHKRTLVHTQTGFLLRVTCGAKGQDAGFFFSSVIHENNITLWSSCFCTVFLCFFTDFGQCTNITG